VGDTLCMAHLKFMRHVKLAQLPVVISQCKDATADLVLANVSAILA
jgi:hypothetical protein